MPCAYSPTLPPPPPYRCTVSVAWAVIVSTRAMTRTTPVVCGSDTMARAIPPRVLVWAGVSATLHAHPGSTSNVTGTPSTGCPWASCTCTINAAACGKGVLLVELPGPIQMTGSETSRENLYPAPGVGPTSFGAQAVPPRVNTRHVKTKVRCRTIGCSLYWAHSCRRCRCRGSHIVDGLVPLRQ
jgi:hypothetical protein